MNARIQLALKGGDSIFIGVPVAHHAHRAQRALLIPGIGKLVWPPRQREDERRPPEPQNTMHDSDAENIIQTTT